MKFKQKKLIGKKLSARLVTLFEKHIRDRVCGDTVNLLLSGGIESETVGYAAHEIGLKIKAFTCALEGVPSFDAKHAERTSDTMGWEWTLVEAPTDENLAYKALKHIASRYNAYGKRDFEACYIAYFGLHRIKTTSNNPYVLSGMCAGTHSVANERRANIEKLAGKHSKYEDFLSYRLDRMRGFLDHGYGSFGPNYNIAGYWQHLLMYNDMSLVGIVPFLDRQVIDLTFQNSWHELNLPKQKQFLADMYPDHVLACGHRSNRNFHKEAKVDIMFKFLLDSKYNKNNHKSVTGVFHDIARENSSYYSKQTNLPKRILE